MLYSHAMRNTQLYWLNQLIDWLIDWVVFHILVNLYNKKILIIRSFYFLVEFPPRKRVRSACIQTSLVARWRKTHMYTLTFCQKCQHNTSRGMIIMYRFGICKSLLVYRIIDYQLGPCPCQAIGCYCPSQNIYSWFWNNVVSCRSVVCVCRIHYFVLKYDNSVVYCSKIPRKFNEERYFWGVSSGTPVKTILK